MEIAQCICHKCQNAKGGESIAIGTTLMHFNKYMAICSICGNKRCPKATDHDNVCTNSNEPGQIGSIYGPQPND